MTFLYRLDRALDAALWWAVQRFTAARDRRKARRR